ncbi:MAG: hypothetical protein PHQ90_05455 [Sulfuricurvum sp.]|uniref:hypothetical protein n=1 Tax=Sulfuricurvum sp. TaxID=2025608 RepID=UPI002620811C|nr:hypothetical protein [Sulfuricurvum sp.]MDD2368730.1 hypothetical protein [Sulfuricurvum sp.]MDD2951197.1 hypothetical protein [Sulfuricurvum sp.]MDD5119041.1 hypothetical protein [Sulfuricurvum sp.]
MDDEKLKIVLALLSGIIFSLIFILLAFVLPVYPPKVPPKTMDSELRKISKEYKKSQLKPPPEHH